MRSGCGMRGGGSGVGRGPESLKGWSRFEGGRGWWRRRDKCGAKRAEASSGTRTRRAQGRSGGRGLVLQRRFFVLGSRGRWLRAGWRGLGVVVGVVVVREGGRRGEERAKKEGASESERKGRAADSGGGRLELCASGGGRQVGRWESDLCFVDVQSVN
ncbi:hypothetical protein BKA80DRAFT_110181 [Phyllosticta citrichinensis]